MTNLEQKTEAYANARLKYYPDTMLLKVEVRAHIEEAYEQGRGDRD